MKNKYIRTRKKPGICREITKLDKYNTSHVFLVPIISEIGGISNV